MGSVGSGWVVRVPDISTAVRGDLVRDRALRHAERVGGEREAPGVYDGAQRAQRLDVDLQLGSPHQRSMTK